MLIPSGHVERLNQYQIYGMRLGFKQSIGHIRFFVLDKEDNRVHGPLTLMVGNPEVLMNRITEVGLTALSELIDTHVDELIEQNNEEKIKVPDLQGPAPKGRGQRVINRKR